MNRILLFLAVGLILSGCKLGGTGENIQREITLIETNTGHSVTINSDGPFQFAEDFPLKSPYNIELLPIDTDIALALPDCEISNASGVILNDVNNIKVTCETGQACTANYNPVCGKAPNNIVCITAPCQNYQYQTFGNLCEADRANAKVSFRGECQSLENVLSFSDKPVKLEDLHLLGDVLPESIPDLLDAEIDGDILTLKVGFSGCDADHEIDLLVGTAFTEALQIGASTLLQHSPIQDCEAYFEKTVTFDLLPVKHRYIDLYQQSSGSVELDGIGIYQF